MMHVIKLTNVLNILTWKWKAPEVAREQNCNLESESRILGDNREVMAPSEPKDIAVDLKDVEC